MENIHTKTKIIILDSIKTTKRMDMVHCSVDMDLFYMKENGKMECQFSKYKK